MRWDVWPRSLRGGRAGPTLRSRGGRRAGRCYGRGTVRRILASALASAARSTGVHPCTRVPSGSSVAIAPPGCPAVDSSGVARRPSRRRRGSERGDPVGIGGRRGLGRRHRAARGHDPGRHVNGGQQPRAPGPRPPPGGTPLRITNWTVTVRVLMLCSAFAVGATSSAPTTRTNIAVVRASGTPRLDSPRPVPPSRDDRRAGHGSGRARHGCGVVRRWPSPQGDGRSDREDSNWRPLTGRQHPLVKWVSKAVLGRRGSPDSPQGLVPLGGTWCAKPPRSAQGRTGPEER